MSTPMGIKKLFRMILEYYPSAKVSLEDSAVKAWGLILGSVPDNDLLLGLAEYVTAGNDYPPKASDMAKICNVQTKALGAGDESAWLHEWARSGEGRAVHVLAVESYPNVYANLHGTFAKCQGCPNNPITKR